VNPDHVLRSVRNLQPFRARTVEHHGGKRLESDHLHALVLRAGVAVFIVTRGVPMFFDYQDVINFRSAPASLSPNGE
jgi:hypothetical protein